MKLLLTSAGITNSSIKMTLLELMGKSPEETTVAFIPTAADVEPGHKDWFVRQIDQFLAVGAWKQFDVVDIAAMERKFWEPRLLEADVIFVSGGNEFFLMYQIENTGLAEILPELLKTKVWVGISAGSMVLGKRIEPELAKLIYEEEIVPPFDKVEAFLEYVEFAIKPHMGEKFFPKANEKNLEMHAAKMKGTFYGIDDQTAICIDGDRLEVISEGKWRKFN